MSKRFCLLLILIFTASTLLLVNLVSASIPEPSVPEFTFEPRPIQLSEDNTITSTFFINYRWFKFRLVYNQTTETYSVYSLGELIVGQSSLKDQGDLVAENMQGPTVSTEGTYNPLEINSWFETKTIDNINIIYYDGIEVLTVFPENLPSEAIKVLSPENKTYNTPDVPIEYITNQIFHTITYSLDGKGNQTIKGNIGLSGLKEDGMTIVLTGIQWERGSFQNSRIGTAFILDM